MTTLDDIAAIRAFLGCETPAGWIDAALQNQPTMLIDHANCELKAAQSAQTLIWKYGASRPGVTPASLSPDGQFELINKMSKLAREELRHFEQVVAIMKKRGVDYVAISASRYAAGMREGIRNHEPEKLVDGLIIGAYIEARSCERFAKLAPFLDIELSEFYSSLLKSEARHFEDYLKLAQSFSREPIDERVSYYRQLEQGLIERPDAQFRFHSGPPQ